MAMHIENFPNELWFEIFDYLPVHNIFESFSNLNQYFDILLSSSQLLFQIELKSDNNDNIEHLLDCYRSSSVLNRVISLKSSINHNYDYFPHFFRNQSTKLTQLRSLLIKVNTNEIPSICQILSQIQTLYYLSLACIPNQNLLESILSSRSLRQCRFDFWRLTTVIQSQLQINSNIESLYIKLNDDINHSIMNLLLSHLPKLKKLELLEENFINKTRHPLFNFQINRFDHLETLKITWGYHSIQFNHLENLSSIIPNLKYLSLTMFYLTIDQILNTILIDQLLLILKNRLEMKISIYCRRFTTKIEHDLSKILNNFCQNILITMKKQTNGYVKVTWTEENLKRHQIQIYSSRYLSFQ